MNKFRIYTDGSCLGNPGAGGWAAVVIDETNGRREEFCGGESHTTNNRMELTAAIVALKKISAGDSAEIFTDSSYLKNAFTQGWLTKWKRNGWKTANKTPVLNQDLWVELDSLIANRRINFNWVKGHAGNFYNERCDILARDEAARYQAQTKKAAAIVPATTKENFKPVTREEIQKENPASVQMSLFD